MTANRNAPGDWNQNYKLQYGNTQQEVLQEWLIQKNKQLQSLLERLKDNEEYAVKTLTPKKP